MLSLALLVRPATRVTLVEISRVSVCGLLLAHVLCMLTLLKHWCYLTIPQSVPPLSLLKGGTDWGIEQVRVVCVFPKEPQLWVASKHLLEC